MESTTPIEGLGTQFSADVIEREGQNILLIIDHFISLVSSTILPSEKAVNLKAGIITLTTAVRHPEPISVVTDWAPGFVSISKDDKDLKDLHVTIVLKDQLNKNYNRVANRACQDLESEIRKLAPEGRKLSPSTLAKATISVNTIMEKKGYICV